MALFGYTFPCQPTAGNSGDARSFGPTGEAAPTVTLGPAETFARNGLALFRQLDFDQPAHRRERIHGGKLLRAEAGGHPRRRASGTGGETTKDGLLVEFASVVDGTVA